jgi:ApeA N-terminal domain 1
MLEEIGRVGEWWLPRAPEDTRSGTLRIHPSGRATLTTVGEIPGVSYFSRPTNVVGHTSSGEDITLCLCQFAGGTSSAKRTVSQGIYESPVIILGADFSEYHSVRTCSLKFELPSARAFIAPVGLLERFSGENEGEILIRAYQQPFRERCVVGEDRAVEIELTGPRSAPSGSRLNVSQDVFIEVSASSEVTIEGWLPVLVHLRDFFTFATGAETPFGPLHSAAVQGQGRPYRILVGGLHREPEAGLLSPRKSLFDYRQLDAGLAPLLTRWFAALQKLKPVFDLYFTGRDLPPQRVNTQFLILAQAAEAYHRRKLGGEYIGDDAYRVGVLPHFVAAIPATMKEDFRASLENKLKYLHEFSLRRRIRELCKSLPAVGRLAVQNSEAFAEDVAHTRNYMTHYEEELAALAKTGTDLYNLTEYLLFLVDALLLSELGFKDRALEKILKETPRHFGALSMGLYKGGSLG